MPGSDRYQLVDCVVAGSGWARWRGRDSLLHRDVGLLVVTPEHPHQTEVGVAARQASLVADGRFLHVYDVAEVDEELWIVEEWAPGIDLTERVAEAPLSVQDACALGIQVAQALSTAHSQGVVHAALGPGDVWLTEDGRTKIDGLATRTVLEGPAGADHPAADSWAAAAVTYAALTGCWPGHARDRMPGTPRGTSPSRPRLVRPGVPKAVDGAVSGALERPPRDPIDVAAALESVLTLVGRRSGDRTDDASPKVSPATARAMAFGAGAVLVAAAVAGGLWIGVEATRDPTTETPDLAASQSSSPGVSPTTSPDPSSRLAVVAGRDFDPDGNGEEEPDLVPLAFDDNLATAWHTLNYRQADLAPKAGVGVVFDLGAVEPVGAVRLNLLGAGTSLQVRVAPTGGTKLSDFQKFGSATNLGDLVALRSAEPVEARYILVWLTRLPADGDTFRGGITEIEVARS